VHGFRCGLAQNDVGNMGKLTWRSSMALTAPRRLAVTAGLILLGSAYGFSNGPPTTKRLSAGMTASPRAHRLLQFMKGSAKTRVQKRARVSSLRVQITMI
jgi:hypothetical protein